MNTLLRLHKDMAICGLLPLKTLLYAALLSNVTTLETGDVKYGVYAGDYQDLYDTLSDWDSDEIYKALNELSDDGLIWFDEEDNLYLGEFRGKRFFTFEQKSSLVDEAVKLIKDAVKTYGKSKSAKDKSRSRYLLEKIEALIDKGVDQLRPSDFTDLHGYLYEVYTGGEIYNIRNKTEYYQTSNMLKAYDRNTVLALIAEGTLHYDKYRSKGMPTLTNVACMKDDVYHGLVRESAGSKEYMREGTSESDF